MNRFDITIPVNGTASIDYAISEGYAGMTLRGVSATMSNAAAGTSPILIIRNKTGLTLASFPTSITDPVATQVRHNWANDSQVVSVATTDVNQVFTPWVLEEGDVIQLRDTLAAAGAVWVDAIAVITA